MTHSTVLESAYLAVAIAMTLWLPGCGDGNGGGGGSEGEETEGTDEGDTGGDDDADVGSDGTSGGATADDEGSSGEPVDAQVQIYRDEHGVPHVVAATDAGALYGLGYASAQDRLLQMTISVVAAQGRLAEYFGEDYFEHDEKFRTMGHWRHAERMADALPAEHQALLAAYADGVNAWIADSADAINPMFQDAGLEPPTWTPAHSLAVWYRVSDLFTNDPSEKAAGLVDFEQLVSDVGIDEAIAQSTAAHPGDPSTGVVQASDVPQGVQDSIADYAEQMGYGATQGGMAPLGYGATAPHDYGHVTPKFSHAWVVSGERTTTGDAVLVSDPQVAVSAPNFLYEWAVVGETIHARGASAAGVPGLLIGYTPDVAWGMTAAGVDSRDLYRLDMSDATHYLVDGQEYELSVETETILVAGGASRDIEYRESVWGPVISGLTTAEGEWAMKGAPFHTTATDPFVAMVAMMRATTLDELRGAMDDWTTPSANFVAAGPDGSIFFTVIGDIPLRSPMSPLGGMVAQDGSSMMFDWADIIPAEYKPWVLDPADGQILSANHRPVADWYPLPLGVGQGGGGDTFRSRRLRELLQALPGEVEPSAVLDDVQWDCVNSVKRDLVALGAHVQALQPGRMSQSTLDLLDHLDAWLDVGGSMLSDQSGVFLADRINTKFRIDDTGPVLNALFGGGQSGLSLFLDTMMSELAAAPSSLPSDEAIAYVDLTLGEAWDSAMALNGNPGAWDAIYANGTATPTYAYMTGMDVQDPGFGSAVQSPTLSCADGNTIWSQKGETYTQFVDLADIDGSRTILAPGNNEGPDGAMWTSQLELWSEGTLKSTAMTVEAIEALGEPAVTLTFP